MIYDFLKFKNEDWMFVISLPLFIILFFRCYGTLKAKALYFSLDKDGLIMMKIISYLHNLWLCTTRA